MPKKEWLMKVLRCFLVLFCVLAFANSPRAQAQAPAPAGVAPEQVSGPKAEIPEMSFDFGELSDSGDYAHAFIVKNVGTAPLEIKKVLPG
jgi:hypothetical protein